MKTWKGLPAWMIVLLLVSAITTACALTMTSITVHGVGFITYTGNAELTGVDFPDATALKITINFKATGTYTVKVWIGSNALAEQSYQADNTGEHTFTWNNVGYPAAPFTIKVQVSG